MALSSKLSLEVHKGDHVPLEKGLPFINSKLSLQNIESRGIGKHP
jgi:hypothetical protein